MLGDKACHIACSSVHLKDVGWGQDYTQACQVLSLQTGKSISLWTSHRGVINLKHKGAFLLQQSLQQSTLCQKKNPKKGILRVKWLKRRQGEVEMDGGREGEA